MRQCKELTENERKTTNGCGSSYWLAWPFRIPKFVSKSFYCACCCHDIAYSKGRTIEDKHRADDNLKDDMYYSAYRSNRFQKYIKLRVADLVYWCLSSKLSDKCFKKAR